MAIPKILGGSILQGLGMALDFTNSALNRRAQKKQNEADRAHAVQMYERQRQDSIADFNRQNEYNHPEQQMERLRQAGLNPNLVYGKGADNTAASINKTSYQESKLTAPQLDFSFANALSQYQQVQMQKVQTDNMAKQSELIQADIAYRKAQEERERSTKVGQDLQNIKYGVENKILDFDYGQKLRLADIQYDSAILDNAMKNQSMQLNAGRFELEKIKNSSDVASAYAAQLESQARTLQIKAQTAIMNNRAPFELEALKKQLQFTDAQIENLKKTGKLLDGQTAEQAVNTQLKRLEYARDKKYGDQERKLGILKDVNASIQGAKSIFNPFNDNPLGDGLKLVTPFMQKKGK